MFGSDLRLGIAAIGRIANPVLLRVFLGRFPSETERQLFAEGFSSQHAMKPSLLWGLLAVPKCRAAFMRLGDIAGQHSRAERAGSPYTGFSELDGNCQTVWTGPPIGFLHFEKCGGSALLSWVARQFHPEQINTDRSRDLPPHLLARISDHAGFAAPSLVWGHYDIPTLRGSNADHAIFTLLREPRARLVSLYHYWRSVHPAKIDPEISFAIGYAQRLSLEDFLNHDDPCLIDTIDNVYVRRLTASYVTGAKTDRLQLAPKDSLRHAAEILKTLFFVGITEQLDRSAARLAALLNIDPPVQPLRRNVTAENHADQTGWFRKIGRAQHSRAAQEALDRRTFLDRELYEAACRSFE